MNNIGVVPLLNFFNRSDRDDIYFAAAGILLQNMVKLEKMTIQDAADMCFTSASTISRLARKAGYKGYDQMRSEISRCCLGYVHENRLVLADLLTGTDAGELYIDMLIERLTLLKSFLKRAETDRAVEIIREADAVYFFCTSADAKRFQQDLFFDGKYCAILGFTAVFDSRLIRKGSNNLAILTESGLPAYRAPDLIEKLRAQGVDILLITCSSDRGNDDAAKLAIHLPGSKSGLDESLFHAYLSLLAIEYRKKYIDAWYYN